MAFDSDPDALQKAYPNNVTEPSNRVLGSEKRNPAAVQGFGHDLLNVIVSSPSVQSRADKARDSIGEIEHLHVCICFVSAVPFRITTAITCYLLPGDGVQAEAEFLHHLADSGEMYITAYGFTLQPMIDQFLANHEAGDPLHIYLDHSQASGTAEKPQVQRLVDAGIEVTIGTSPEGSRFICHTKGIVCLDTPP